MLGGGGGVSGYACEWCMIVCICWWVHLCVCVWGGGVSGMLVWCSWWVHLCVCVCGGGGGGVSGMLVSGV